MLSRYLMPLFLSFYLLTGVRAAAAAEKPASTPLEYSTEDVKQLNDFATTIGYSMICGENIEEDIQLVIYWATATFGDEAPIHLQAFQEQVRQVIASSNDAIMREAGMSCNQIKKMRAATIDYLRSYLHLYRLEGRLPKRPPT